MLSPYKKIIVYDLETGGLSANVNSITEFAAVAIDLENLSIVDEIDIFIQPYFDLTFYSGDDQTEAKNIVKATGQKDFETNIKTVHFDGEKVTLKNLQKLTEELSSFWKKNKIQVYDWSQLKNKSEKLSQIYFDYCYNRQALEVTHIKKEDLEKGVSYKEAFAQIEQFFKKNKVKNSKPVLAGHNIRRFDNKFLEKFFQLNKKTLSDYTSPFLLDTLEWSHLRWFEMASFNLSSCTSESGIVLKDAHRAINDVKANADLVISFLKNLRGFGKKQETYVREKYTFNF